MQFSSVSEFLHYYSKVKGRTKKIVSLINADNIGYSIGQGMFSLGDLARHIPLIELHFYIPIIQGVPTSYKGCDASFGDTPEAILELFREAESQMEAMLTNKPDSFLKERINMPGGKISLRKWLQLLLEHEIHHRGQMYQLLSASGARVPNIFGLSSEELIGLSG